MVEIIAAIIIALSVILLGTILLTSFYIFIGSISDIDVESLHEDEE